MVKGRLNSLDHTELPKRLISLTFSLQEKSPGGGKVEHNVLLVGEKSCETLKETGKRGDKKESERGVY